MRKKKVLVPINDPDSTNTDPAYWEEVLASHGLSMIQGRSPKTFYVDRDQLHRIEEHQEEKSTGRAVPPGHGPRSMGNEGAKKSF